MSAERFMIQVTTVYPDPAANSTDHIIGTRESIARDLADRLYPVGREL